MLSSPVFLEMGEVTGSQKRVSAPVHMQKLLAAFCQQAKQTQPCASIAIIARSTFSYVLNVKLGDMDLYLLNLASIDLIV